MLLKLPKRSSSHANGSRRPDSRIRRRVVFLKAARACEMRACYDAYNFKFCIRCSFDTLEENRIARREDLFGPAGLRPFRNYCHNIAIGVFVCGSPVSFQITILKVLAGHPEGRASLADLRRAVAILISSGTDWTDRTKRLAARAPGLDIFSQTLVLRDDTGWQITDAGRALLASVEKPAPVTATSDQGPEVVVTLAPVPASPAIRLAAASRRRPRRRAGDRMRSSAA